MHPVDEADDVSRPPVKALEIPAGYGPRHLAYDPIRPAAYVQCELVARILVAVIDPETGDMTIREEHDTAAPDQMDISAPAAVKLHPSGRTLAVSNRFDDTIAVFAIDRSSGAPSLTLADRFPCGGQAPRDIEFNSTGTRLFIANQDSHAVTCRFFDGESGLPADGWAEPLETGSPVCIVMLD
jgi:6-phosphogluconolactonase